MYKRIFTILISCAMLSALALTGCNSDTNSNNETSSSAQTSTNEAADNSADQPDAQAESQTDTSTDATAPTDENNEVAITEDEEGTFIYEDETVTNPTVAPIDLPDETATASAEVTATSLAGTWMPLMAVSVADSQEVPFQDIYGSSYTQYGGSLVIAEDSSFKISMGASILEGQSSGTFTTSQNNLLVTYADGSVDTYLYIPQYQNHEVIKTQVRDYYVYFYKEA